MSVEAVSAAPWLRRYSEIAPRLPGADRPAVKAAREAALARFARHGFPLSRVEAWKYTNLQPLTAPLPDAQAASVDVAPWRVDGAHAAVFVNGQFQAALSDLPPQAMPLSTAGALESLLVEESDAKADTLAAFNAASARDGIVLDVPAGVRLDRPLHLLFVTAGPAAAVQVRNIIRLGEGARAAVLESHVGEGAHWVNVVTRVEVAAAASLELDVLQAQPGEAWHTGRIAGTLDQGARFANCTVQTGGRTARRELLLTYAGTDVEVSLTGANLGRGQQHLDYFSQIGHAKPDGRSNQVFKTVVEDRALSVFQGRLLVAEDAQRTDAQQLCRSLLLSDHAAAYAKPELEILADDVKCSHGATIGDLDEQALFYLRARGIPLAEARALLIGAFVAETVEAVEQPHIRAHLHAVVQRWLAP